MKVKDMIAKQEEYIEREKIIAAMYIFKKDFYDLYHGNDTLRQAATELGTDHLGILANLAADVSKFNCGDVHHL